MTVREVMGDAYLDGPRRRPRVCLVGMAPSQIATPTKDYSYDIWTLNGAWQMERSDLHWQMHNPERANILHLYDERYVAWLESAPCPVMMQAKVDWVPTSQAFDLEGATLLFGRMWACTFTYMMAQAITDGYEEIGLSGIELLADEEYRAQRESVQYMRGIALGKGIRVTFPGGSALESWGVRYGYDHPAEHLVERAKTATQRDYDNAKARHDKAAERLQFLQGARDAFLHVQDMEQARHVEQQIAQAMGEVSWCVGVMSEATRTMLTLDHVSAGGAA